MSVAALVSDTPVSAAPPRADKKSAKAGDDPASDFKTLVKGDTEHKTSQARQEENADSAKGENGEAAKDGDDRMIWRRYGPLYDRHPGKVQSDAGKATDGNKTEEATDETDTDNAGAVAGVVSTTSAATGREKPATKAADMTARVETQDQPARPNMGADGEAVAAAAKNSEAPGDVRAATPGALPGEAATLIGQKPERLQTGPAQAPRAAAAEHAQSSQQSPSADIVVSEADAGDQASAEGKGGKGDGQSGDQPASRFAQAQGGNRISGVTVVSQQVMPAMPAQPAALAATGVAFVDSVAQGIAKSERIEAATQASLAKDAAKPGPVTTLNIQLRPAELGMVTARISGTEAQMSIEITVDNAEARHRLATDSDAIVTALRGMGIDVDRITVQQSQANSGATPNNAGRGNDFAQPGGGRGSEQQASQQGFERGRGGDSHGGQGNAKPDSSGSGVYI